MLRGAGGRCPAAALQGNPEDLMPTPPQPVPPRHNVRTALVLLSIAAVFFIGVIARRYLIG